MQSVPVSWSVSNLARTKLAERGRLAPDSARLRCTPIQRGGQICGMHFALRGPRDVLLTAVWDASTQTLWCYDSRGERFLRLDTGQEGLPEKMID